MRKKEFLNKILIADAIVAIILGIFISIHYKRPSEASGIALIMDHMATGGIVLTAGIFILVNIGGFVYYRYLLK